ncbi:hypothetical protein BJY04DRAFT_217306 [Aspergillus karnatakaensis]|uniref:uncharacterized protein n=1 Tax=Aspergillus karnatakaensis TaxID=1810916 RepID=UPI003CCDE6FF
MLTDKTMKSKTNGIDDFPAHWKTTLLGEEFWKDAEDWNRETNARIDADHDRSLHTRFPFNIGPEQTPPRAPSIITTAADSDSVIETIAEPVPPVKRSRRFSMSDALNLSPFTGRTSSLLPPNRVLDLSRGSRSRSNSRVRSSSVTPDIRRSNSLIRSTLNRMSGRRKVVDETEDEESEIEVSTREPSPIIIPFTPDQATPANPLMEFRGGALWNALPRDRRTLGIDVFWPISFVEENEQKDVQNINTSTTNKPTTSPTEEEEPTIFPFDEMAPLCTFRNLRSLKVTGMMQSYQLYIFMAAWLNTNLEELEIGMALPPRLRRGYKWPYIKGGWRLDKATYGEPVYYGDGEGSLPQNIGLAAYLDKTCLEKAKIRAMSLGSTRNRLSIRTLILTSVVVDADPFLHWFDPNRLKCIHFKDNCVDAGFWLSHCMRKVSVLFPKSVDNKSGEKECVAREVRLRSFNGGAGRGELKVVRIEGGVKVGEVAYRGKESLVGEIPRNVGVGAQEKRGKDEGVEKKEDGKEEKGNEIGICESQIGIAF